MIFRYLNFVLLVLLVACAPRGETKTLDEVLALAKARFNDASLASASNSQISAEVIAALKTVSENLNVLSSSETVAVATQIEQVSHVLSSLINRSAYTARPGMGELLAQYRGLGNNAAINNGQLKLLAARTYSILASELETTGFSVN